MMKRLFSVAFVFMIIISSGSAQSIVPAEWKFITGDKPEYIDSAMNEYWWEDISPLKLWESQGFAGYDGFAWYRVKVVVPASMKKNAFRYDGLMLSLGKIDDSDVTFFNGHEVGSTGKMPPDYSGAYDVPRAYLIPPEIVQWGKKNTIAVRVYDAGGGGGLYGGPVELTNRGNPDLLTLNTGFKEQDMIIRGSPDAEIPVTLKSEFRKKYRGALTLKITTDFGEEFVTKYREVAVKKKSTGHFTFTIRDLRPGFYKAVLSLESKMGNKKHFFNFGYEPEKIVSPADPQPDFDEFWQRAKAELATADPQFRMIRVDSLCTDKKNVYLVEMRSLGNALIRGWDQVFYTLSYFDIKNLAHMIKAPMIMGVGLRDEVCPPHINFAAYNLVTSGKRYIVYPDAGHGLPEDFYRAKMEWIRTEFGLN